MKNFCEAINDSKLMDMGYSGFPFTWSNNTIGQYTARAKLDRGLCTREFLQQFPRVNLHHLTVNRSDHMPLMVTLRMGDQIKEKPKKRLLYEEQWALFPGSKEIIQDVWADENEQNTGVKVFEKIQNTRLGLLA